MPSYHAVSPNGKVQKVDRRKAGKMPFLPENIQLPLRRLGEHVKGGLTGLMLRLVLAVLGEMMEAELVSRVGPKGQHRQERCAYRVRQGAGDRGLRLFRLSCSLGFGG